MRILHLLLIFAALLISGCARPEYWVKGLTLPPGSTVKSRNETVSKSTDGTKPKFGAQPSGTLMIYFDSTSTWEQVAAHIGAGLKQEGFTEAPNVLANLGGDIAAKAPIGGSMLKEAAKGFLDTTRVYKKEGSDYTVTLTNMKSIMESKIYAQLKKFRKEGHEPNGQYMLMVSNYREGTVTSEGVKPEPNVPGK